MTFFSAKPHTRSGPSPRALALTMLTALASLLSACGDETSSFIDELDLSEFETITAVESLDLDTISVDAAVTYWELREDEQHPDGAPSVLSASGQLCDGAGDEAACRTEFEELSSTAGFGWHSHPLDLFYYLAVNEGESNSVIASKDDVLSFLGDIESTDEAVLAALAEGYYWDTDKEAGAVKEVDGGFELIVVKSVSLCMPIQSNRILLRIDRDGTQSVLREEVLRKLDDHCA